MFVIILFLKIVFFIIIFFGSNCQAHRCGAFIPLTHIRQLHCVSFCHSHQIIIIVIICAAELYHARLEFESMKKQAESVTNEYDRLLEEHSKVQVSSFTSSFSIASSRRPRQWLARTTPSSLGPQGLRTASPSGGPPLATLRACSFFTLFLAFSLVSLAGM